jgi:hypothetical protein
VDCWDTAGTSSIGDGVLNETIPLAEFSGQTPQLDSLYPYRFADLEIS